MPNRHARNRFRRFSPHFIKRLSSWLVLSTTLTVGVARAATYYWDADGNPYNNNAAFGGAGTGSAGVWNTTVPQWWLSSGLSDQAWSNGGNDTAVFSGSAGTVTLGEDVTAGGLTFNTTGYTINSGTSTLSFGLPSSEIALNNVAAATITGAVGGTGGVTLTGGVFGGATAATLTLNGTSTGGWSGATAINNGMTLSLSANNQALANTSGITLNGGGILVTNTSTAEGSLDRISNTAPVTLNGGSLTFTNTSGSIYAETIGTVELVSGSFNMVYTANMTSGSQTLTLGGLTRTGGASNTSTANFGSNSNLNATTNVVAVTGATATPAGQIIGPWMTTGNTGGANDYAVYNASGRIIGAAIGNSAETTWTAPANAYTNTASGTTTLTGNRTMTAWRYSNSAAGTLALGANNFETLGILNSAAGLLTISGGGVVRQTGTAANNLFVTTGQGSITIASVIADNTGALTLVKAGIGANNTLTLSGANTYSGGTVINGGTVSIAANGHLGAVTGGLTFNGSGGLTFTAATTVGTPATPGNRAITLNNGALATITTGAFNSSLIGNISGNGGIILAGNSGNVLTIGQSGSTSTYSGPTVINLGTLRAGVVDAFGTNSAVTLSNTSGTVLDLAGFNAAIGSLSGGGTTSGNVTLGSAALTVGGNNESTTYGGVISGTNGVLTKTGSGILTLTGNNSYTGATNFNGGLIAITTLNNLTTANNALNFGGGGIQWAVGSGVDPSARTMTFNSGGGTFDTNTNVIVFANPVGNGGAGGLTKIGPGALFLQGANTYTGATTVSGGVLNIQNAVAVSNSSGVTVASSFGALALQGGFNFGAAPLTLNGDGSGVFSSGALVNIAGANTYGGTLTLGSSSTVSVDSGSLDLSGTGAITGAGFTLTLGGSGNGTLAGGIQTGSGGLTKTGTGTWTLTGAGTYTGATTINGGKLIVDLGTNNTGVLGSASALAINGSDLTIVGASTGTSDQTIASLNLGAGVNAIIAIDPNNGTGTTLTITGPTWTRGTGATALFDYSSANTGTRTATVTNVPTGTGGASGANNILGYALVKDSGGVTGLAHVDGSNNISRFDSTAATQLTASSNSATTDYTTLGNAGTLTWTDGGALTNRSVNSLTIDSTGNSGQITDMGAASNVLTITSGALQFVGTGSSTATLAGGTIGSAGSPVFIYGEGSSGSTFNLASRIEGGPGSVIRMDSGRMVLSGNNTFNGSVLLNGGVLQIGNSGALNATAPNAVIFTAGSTGTLRLGGFNTAVSALDTNATASGSAIVENASATSAMLTVKNPRGSRSTFAGLVQDGSGGGSLGLTKSGNGTLALTNNANTFSGDVSVKEGQLVISDAGQLGTGTTAISVTGVAQTGNPGTSGGTLMLQGNATSTSATGITLNREVSIAGRGPNAVNNTGGVVSIGYNTLGSGLTFGSNVSESRIWATHGTTTISDNLFLGASGQSAIFQGNGNYIISGQVSGNEVANDRFIKTGQLIGTTIWLQNANNNFTQSIRIDNNTVRVGSVGALGINTSNAAVDLNNGALEIRTDSPDFSSRNVQLRNNTTGAIFVDHAIASLAQNQTVALGNLHTPTAFGNNSTLNFNGRNGYGVTFSSTSGGGDGNLFLTNNSSGLLTISSNITAANASTARTLTMQGNGDHLLVGNFTPGGSGAHVLTKAGRGTLEIRGTASTYTGNTNISDGTLAIRRFSGINATTGTLNIGNGTTTSGAFSYLGAEGTGAGETATKAININTTTSNDVIFANQSGTAPTGLVLSGTITAVAGSKILYLGGANYQNGVEVQLNNEITSQIPDSATLQLGKTGTGTWVLSHQNNLFNGTTSIYGGTLKLKATAAGTTSIIKTGGAVTFAADTAANTGWTGRQTAAGTLQYDGFSSGSPTTNTQGLGSLTVSAGAATVRLNPGTNNTITLTFTSLVAPAIGTGLNFVVPAGNTVTTTGVASGLVNAHAYFNGADFAYSNAGTLRAPVYGTDATFSAATSTALTASSNNLINGSFSNGAVAITSLKISGSQTLTQTGLLTIGGATGGGILMTGGSGTISGTGVTTASAGDLVVRVNGSGDVLTISAPVTSTTTGGITKNGAGTLVLSGANAQTGTVNVNEGTLQLSGSALLGATNSGLAVRQGATFDLNGVNVGTVASGTNSVDAFNGAGTITNSAASGTASLRVGNNGGGGTFSGLIQDGATAAVSFVKHGAGTLSLTNANTFTGGITLNGGTLAVTSLADIGVASGIGAGIATDNATNAASLVFNGGTLQYTGATTTIFQTTQTPSVTINRLFTLAGNGTIDSSGSYGANFLGRSANHAALVFNNTADVVFSGAGARTLTLTGDSIGDNALAIHLVNNGGSALSLTKSGGSLWILNPASANTYTGETLVNGGVLRAVDGMGLSSGSLLTLNGGQLESSGTFSRTLGATAGNVRITGGASGFAASTPDRLVVTIGGGGLTWGSTNFNPSSLVLGSSTALGETEITNDINLGTSGRTITVNNNSSTGAMVTAGILSGVISGGAGGNLTKGGGGVLMLGNANTYVGDTIITSGNLIVTSIGNDTGTTASSLGASGGMIIYNQGDTDLNGIFYVGAGETATRPWRLNTTSQISTNRTVRIDATGSGALVLGGAFTNTVTANATGRIMTLELRGANTDANMISSILTNSTGTNNPLLAITKNDGGVWVLNPASPNTFTGNISANGGLLGLTANGIGSAGLVSLSNGGIFAHGGDLTTSTTINLSNNATAVFTGSNNITFNGTVQKAAGANDQTISNNMENGAVLTINGNITYAAEASARTLNIRGFGSTVFNGAFVQNSGTNTLRVDIRVADTASFTLGGASLHTGGTLLGQGTLIVANTAALGAAANDVILQGGVLTSTVDLTGANKLLNRVRLAGDQVTISGSESIEFGGTPVALLNEGGNRFLRNELNLGETLTISGQVNLSNDNTGRTLTFRGTGETIISGVVANGGTAAGGLAYSGLNTLVLTGANTATGALTVNRNTVVLSGPNGAWNFGSFVLNPTGVIRLDNTGGDNVLGRLSNTGTFAGNGGTLDIIGDADGSTHTAGALTLNSVQTFITMSGPGPNLMNFASVNFANSGSSLNLAGVPNLGTTNKVTFTAALGSNALINGVMPRTFIAGGNFATYDAVDGVKAFTNYNATSATNINLAAATDTVEVNAGMTTPGLLANKTINALKIDGNGLSVGSGATTLTLSAAALLNTGGNNSIDTSILAFGGNTGHIQVAAGTTLTINAALTGTGGIAKSQPGTLVLNTPTFITSTTNVLRGTLRLNGGLNTLYPNQIFNINDGATLDLNGNTQYVERLGDPGTLPEAGGIITSLSGTGTIVTNMSGQSTTFATSINGNVNLARVGGNTLTLESISTYNGFTALMGGTMVLQDDATIVNSSSIDINYATLQLNNNSSLQRAIYDRVGDTTPITLRGGTLRFDGKVSDPATETFGALTVAQGANTLTANTGGTGTGGAVTSTDLTFASFTRNAGATINFTGNNLGQQGNNSRIIFTTQPSTVLGGALGPWAIANQTDYAAYNAGNGIGIVGQGGYVGYDATFGTGRITNLPAVATTTDTLPAGTTTAAMLRIAGGFTHDIAFTNPGGILNLELGGLLRSDNNNSTTIGTETIRGVLTAGGGETSGLRELIIYGNANTILLNSVIADNGAGNSVQLIKDGANTLTLTAANSFSGGAIVNRGTLNLSPTTPGDVVIPLSANGLTINGGVPGTGVAVNVNSAGAIAAGNDVTLNGRAVLTFPNSTVNTLNSLTINNNGGESAPTVNVGTSSTLNLSSSTPITATSSNAVTTATISGGTVALAAGANTFNIAPIAVNGITYFRVAPTLSITSEITGAGSSITKSGDGLIQLSSTTSTFNGGMNVTGGGIVLAASSTPSGFGTTAVTSGVVGTGTLTMASGTRLLVNNASRTLANTVVFNGDPFFDSTGLTGATLTLNGSITLADLATPDGAVTITVDNPTLTAALLGPITGLGSINSITKQGSGNLSINLTGAAPGLSLTMNNGGALSLLTDGDGTGKIETLSYGTIDAGLSPTLTIGRGGGQFVGGALLFTTASNKIIAPASFSSLANGITLTNNHGYGLLVANNFALSTTGPTANFAGPVFSVANQTVPNVVQGLELSGVISGGATSGVTFTKSGAGTLVLSNSGNTFGGAGAIINVTQGMLSITHKGALGDSGNIIRLAPSTGTSTLRVTEDVTLGVGDATIQFGNTANTRAIEVSNGDTFQLDAAFDVSLASSASLAKGANGVLKITVSNSGWSGTTNILAGVIEISHGSALGTGTINASPNNEFGSALYLSGGITVANPINLQGGGHQPLGGLDSGGQLRSVSGVNTITGVLSQGNFDSAVGASTGATLNINASSFSNGGSAHIVNFMADGTINLNAALPVSFRLGKYGAGTLNINTANTVNIDPSTGSSIELNGGLTVLSGAGTLTGAIDGWLVRNGAAVTLDNNLGSNVNNRTNGGTARAITLASGTINFIANNTSGSSETFGTLTSFWGGNNISFNNGGASNSMLTFGSVAGNAVAVASVLAFTSTETFNSTTNRVVFTTAPTLTNGIIQRAAVIDGAGVNFATYGGGAPSLTAYAAYNPNGTNLNATLVTDTLDLTADQASPGLNGRTINALKITGPNTDITFQANGGNQLAISSGQILVTGGTGNTLGNTVAVMSFGTGITSTQQGTIMVNSGSALEVNGALTNANDVTKGLGGDLTFSARQFFNTGANYLTLVGGTTILNAGTNTLYQGIQGGVAGQHLAVGPGATLNLNGTAQMVGNLIVPNNNAFPDSGGIVTSSSAATLVSVTTGTSEWGGNISGNVFFNKAGSAQMNVRSDNAYTGGTMLTGGTTLLTDAGALSGTTSLTINYGTLQFINNGLSNNLDRVKDTAPITLNGGVISFIGRGGRISSETLGAVTIDSGTSTISSANGSNGQTIQSATLTLASLSRAGANAATVSFAQMYNGTSTGALGVIADGPTTGRSTNIVITAAPTLTNNIIGPWAVTTPGFFATTPVELASYVVPTLPDVDGRISGGVGALNTAGFAGYDASSLPATDQATWNIRIGADATVPSGGLIVNALNLINTTASTNRNLTFTGANDTLNLAGGALLMQNVVSGTSGTASIGTGALPGKLTAGGASPSGPVDLYLYYYNTTNANVLTVNSQIVNNGAQPLRLVLWGAKQGTSTGDSTVEFANGTNSYTGGTVVNGETLRIGATGNLPAGGLTLNGGNLTQVAGGSIGSQNVTLNGNSTVTLVGANSLGNLTFDNSGGSSNPTVTTGGVLTLTGGTITASSRNAGTVATIAGTVDLNGTPTFNVVANPVTINSLTDIAPLTPSLNITALVQNGGIVKTGSGVLQLSASTSTFAGGVDLQAGGLAIGNNTNVTTRDAATGVVNPFTSGPVGTGALNLGAAGTYLTADASRTLSNAVTLAGTQLTLRGINNLSLHGNNATTTLLGNTLVTVETPQAVLTLNMVLDDAGNNYGITKDGLGTLVLGNNNTFTGGVAVNAGTLTLAGLNSGSTAPVFGGNTATINSGGLLALQNNGTGNLGLITYANNVITTGLVSNLHIGNNGANTSNTIVVPDLSLAGGSTLNVSSANGYVLRIANLSGDTVGGAAPQINVAAGTTVVIFSYTGDLPVNIGQGSLVFPDVVTIGTTTTLLGGARVLDGSYPLTVQNAVLTGANMTSFGYSSGGLTGNFATLAAAPPAVVATAVAGLGYTGSNFVVSNLGDGSVGNRPNTISGTAANTTAAFSGFLEITTPGNYTFRSGTDDGMTLYIDGNAVATDAFGHGFTDSAAVIVPLTAGYHAFSYKFANSSTGGGYRLLYSGADTGDAFQTVGGSKVGSSRVDLQACKLEYSIVSPK